MAAAMNAIFSEKNIHYPNFPSAIWNSKTPYSSIMRLKPDSRKPARTKRPLNAFMLFAKLQREHLAPQISCNHSEISKLLGRVWRRLDRRRQEPFRRGANLLLQLHRREFPEYKYRPRKRLPTPVIIPGPSSSGTGNIKQPAAIRLDQTTAGSVRVGAKGQTSFSAETPGWLNSSDHVTTDQQLSSSFKDFSADVRSRCLDGEQSIKPSDLMNYNDASQRLLSVHPKDSSSNADPAVCVQSLLWDEEDWCSKTPSSINTLENFCFDEYNINSSQQYDDHLLQLFPVLDFGVEDLTEFGISL